MYNQDELAIFNIDKFCSGFPAITTHRIFKDYNGTEFDPHGLFSPIYFGNEGSKQYKTTYAYIDLKTKILNPVIFSLLKRLNKKIIQISEQTLSFDLSKENEIVINPQGKYVGLIDIINLIHTINFHAETDERKVLVNIIKNISKDEMFTSKLPVIPPAFRPIYTHVETGEKMLDELNTHYINMLKLTTSSNIQYLDKITKSVYMSKVQLMYQVIYEFVKNKLGKKEGYYRSYMLGKRVDYSARGVIIGDYNIEPYNVGLPYKMAIKLFEPFLLNALVGEREKVTSLLEKYYPGIEYLKACMKIITDIHKGIITDKHEIYNIIKDILKNVVAGKVVCVKRDPSLQRDSWRAFYVKIYEDNVIHINHAVCEGFGADFDGDTMAVYLPLTMEAQKDAREKLIPVYSHKGIGQMAIQLKKDIYQGIFILTKGYDLTKKYTGDLNNMVEMVQNIDQYIKVRGITLSIGRYLFNNTFREYVEKYGFINETLTKKKFNKLYEKLGAFYGNKIMDVIHKMQRLAYLTITIHPKALVLSDLDITDDSKIKRLKEQLDKEKDVTKKTKIINEMKKEVKEKLKQKDSGLYYSIESGASGNVNQANQILGSKGLINDLTGEVSHVTPSFSDGLKPIDFFKSTIGARRGIADRTMNTANAGYLTRQMVYALSFVTLSDKVKDCKTTRYFELSNNDEISKRVIGRYHFDGKKLVLLTPENVKNYDTLRLRSPIFCKSNEICHICYGKLMDTLNSKNIGIIAGSSIGERGTQMTMKTFHTGGSVSVEIYKILEAFAKNQSDIDLKGIKNLMIQKERDVIAMTPLEILIDIEYVNKKDIIVEADNNITIPFTDMIVKYNDKEYRFIANINITIMSDKIVEFNKKYIKLQVNAHDKIFQVGIVQDNFAMGISALLRQINKTEEVKSLLYVFNNLFDIYKDISSLDIVHLEILLSQILRYKKQKRIPARLAKEWEPYKVGLKNVVYLDNWKMGMLFENMEKSITNGLVSSYLLHHENIQSRHSPILDLL